jgi:hypothetical protein
MIELIVNTLCCIYILFRINEIYHSIFIILRLVLLHHHNKHHVLQNKLNIVIAITSTKSYIIQVLVKFKHRIISYIQPGLNYKYQKTRTILRQKILKLNLNGIYNPFSLLLLFYLWVWTPKSAARNTLKSEIIIIILMEL